MNNTVKFTSTNFGGLSASVAYGLGEVAGNSTAGRSVGFNVQYNNGPIYAGLGYHVAKGAAAVAAVPAGTGPFTLSSTTGVISQAGSPAAAQDERKNVLFGATYDFGVAKAHFAYGTTKNTVAQGALPAVVAAGNTNYGDARNTMLGLSAPLGAGRLMASYVRHDDRGVNNFDADQIAVGYSYALSKRTSLYTAYAKINNKNNAFYTVGNAGNAGIGNSAFNLGVAHTF